jgi:hypothetical protein
MSRPRSEKQSERTAKLVIYCELLFQIIVEQVSVLFIMEL